jgi:hypothetical protein
MATITEPALVPQQEQDANRANLATESNRPADAAVLLFDRGDILSRDDVEATWVYVAAKLSQLPADVATDAAAAAQELVDNAFLYGLPTTSRGFGLKATRSDRGLRLEITNRVGTFHDLHRLVDAVEAIRNGDPMVMYTDALNSVDVEPEGETAGAGLLRVVAEYGFILDWRVDGQVVTIGAFRPG